MNEFEKIHQDLHSDLFKIHEHLDEIVYGINSIRMYCDASMKSLLLSCISDMYDNINFLESKLDILDEQLL